VTVTDEGILTGVKAGEADITATLSDPSGKPATCHVIVYGDDPEPEPHYDPKLTVTLSSDTFTYDGKRHLPKVTVMSGDTVLGENLTASNDKVFIIYYDSESTAPGTYTVAAVARDWQLGYGEASYNIGIEKTEIKKLIRGRKRFTAYWKRISIKRISGYQIRYCLKNSMTGSSVTTKTVSRLKNWTTIKNLKRGRKYYVQVRTFVKYDGIRYYTSWSNRKSVRCLLI
jgi:hypothetical protein